MTKEKYREKSKALKTIEIICYIITAVVFGTIIGPRVWPFWTSVTKFTVFVLCLVVAVVILDCLIKITDHLYYKNSK
ncbi:hypothetical protein F5ESL0228_00705 [Lactobacillus sp. ESL0228]|nr:hypothetical protein F5ESL0228_00705 [Lactobacillus sp. ESL0228]